MKPTLLSGFEIFLGTAPGWCGAGGPCITPARSLQHLQSSTVEVATHLGQALKWNAENPQATEINNVIVYNWNEFTEGGWLCPTLKSGDDRLRAIRELRRRAGNAIAPKSNRKP